MVTVIGFPSGVTGKPDPGATFDSRQLAIEIWDEHVMVVGVNQAGKAATLRIWFEAVVGGRRSGSTPCTSVGATGGVGKTNVSVRVSGVVTPATTCVWLHASVAVWGST
jgi:hypothetical protein